MQCQNKKNREFRRLRNISFQSSEITFFRVIGHSYLATYLSLAKPEKRDSLFLPHYLGTNVIQKIPPLFCLGQLLH